MKNRTPRGKRKTAKKTRRRPVPKGKLATPQTADEYFAKSEHFQDKWNRSRMSFRK